MVQGLLGFSDVSIKYGRAGFLSLLALIQALTTRLAVQVLQLVHQASAPSANCTCQDINDAHLNKTDIHFCCLLACTVH